MILDVNYGSKEKIKAVEGDNLERIETIYLKANGEIVNLQGLTCDMAYMDITNIGVGNVIENLTISNPTGGEVQLPINNEITKRNGYYNCELRLKNSSGLIKHTAYFELEISKNIFNQIAKPILNSEGFKKIQEILSSIDTYNKDLENKLNTLSSLDSSNLAAKENIKNLQDNSNKATELNKTLTSNVASVDSKNKVLQDSIKQAEDFSKTLQGGTDFVQMRKDIDTLENNLKDTQSLSYSGSDITCKNSLAGRTINMKLYGRTLQNVIKIPDNINENGITTVGNLITMVGNNSYPTLNYKSSLFKPDTKYTLFVDVKELNNIDNTAWCLFRIGQGDGKVNTIVPNPTSIGLYRVVFTTPSSITMADTFMRPNANGHTVKLDKLRIIEGEIEYVDYFEGIKNVGNKINILSSNNTDNKAPNYKEYKKEFQLPQGQEFNGLSNIQDTIEETNEGVVLTQNIGKRAYEVGDENLPNTITDKVNTYYVLDKPIKIILKGIEETDIDTYNIITYVKSLNTIPAAIDFSICTNYGSLLNQHSQEINRIWDTINNILVPTIAEVAERSVKTSMNLLSLK